MPVNDRNLQKIRTLLQDVKVQARVRENIRKGQEEARVTIGRASELFGIKPSKLRELDELLEPKRSTGTETGQRQYSLTDLQKLAVIRELLDEGYSIPPNIDEIWQEVSGSEKQWEREIEKRGDAVEYLPINKRIENARTQLFWRYFASRVLRLSLALIREGLSTTMAGLILPLHTKLAPDFTPRIEDLPKVGESLVGWLGRSNSSHTLLTSVPSFQYGDDYYRIQRLQVITDDKPEGAPKDSTLILLDRRIKHLTLAALTMETIHCLLSPLYEDPQRSQSCFGYGMRDELDPAPDFDGSLNYPDIILDGLAEMIVHLGGQSISKEPHWRFCCILLPSNLTSMVSMQQCSLIVRAQSKLSPHETGVTMLSPQEPAIGLSIRAFQSGRIIYRPEILPQSVESSMVALGKREGPIRSAIAVPIGGEDGLPIGAIYVTSYETQAFPESSHRLLRLMGRMVEELVRTYRVRNREIQEVTGTIKNPSIVDSTFKDFPSENEFYRDIESLLQNVKLRNDVTERPSGEVISLIAIDVDNQSILANRYGDRLARNLSREIGGRLQKRLSTMFSTYEPWSLYYIYTDRFYILLRNVPLEKAREKAERLRQDLRGPYQVDALRPPAKQAILPDSMQVIPDITVRLGVSSYSYDKLRDILGRYPEEEAVDKVRALIVFGAEKSLEEGRIFGGDIIISWDATTQEFVRWPPSAN